ncbi:energy transducer TonB [Saccharophagus degradans]|uniref:TonB-like protein n=2 Tax=Saccharophagus degradans TaxID=86304 RepID=Q21NV9_SACD2|nr:energy transducer TonB [Saccharophagus degradans]ABD79620.1 TonB-like protein [Saccharophagus degradans 2-40]MBU2986359.1 energy transducer TonB [Saccharophagus degradans]MDO6423430.1 energy transducer TonB [Saccharophagus degradans]MDO6606835.1 energy transducer TonB [Saccharophagus degradans]WGO98233.1 energy transducer TonB [Saccharophagus degradans]
MTLARLISSLIPAVAITAGLLLLMHFLINANIKAPEEGEAFKIPEITMPEREIETEYDTKKPAKPDEPEQPPPELPEPEFQDADIEATVSIQPTVKANLDVGGIGGFASDGDYLPIVKVAAKYPQRAAARGIEGYCIVMYTVTKTGETRDVVVDDCPESIFARESIKAAERFKYKPKVINGEPVEVPNVRNRFTFEMAK